MNLSLRIEVLYILKTLIAAGFEAYLVGGAVRDLLLETENIDFDFTTNAKPEEIQTLFPESYYQNDFGTVSITHQELLAQMGLKAQDVELTKVEREKKLIDLAEAKKIHPSIQVPTELKIEADDKTETKDKIDWEFYPDFEITTYRSDEVYADFRKPDPDKLSWGQSITQDLNRRDFTINALALTVDENFLSALEINKKPTLALDENQYQVEDPFEGQTDLENKLIKTVGDPNERFREDALRLLRAIRFSVQLDFKIEEKSWLALKKQAQLLEHISGERIRTEFFKIITSSQPALGIRRLEAVGLLKYILPEFKATQGVEQGGHHTTDVYTHALDSLAACPSQDPIVRLATLIHDIGKPQTYQVRAGEITFYNHEIVSSRIADKIGRRLKLSNDEQKRLFTLVRHHMFYYQPDHTDAAIRRFIKRVGLENIDDILALREADRLGSGAKKTSWRLEEMKERVLAQLNQPMSVTDLAVDGHDLMAEFKLEPGPWLGETLDHLLEKVLEEPELNTKEQLLKEARKIIDAASV